MPGAPNRPPEVAAPPPPKAAEPPELKVVRRLVPSHVALLLDSWKGPLSPELSGPFEKAESSLAAGDLAGATSALDLLAIRFAEPRWPSLPEPFRRLRVAIPVPVPPHWDPEHEMTTAEREARRARRIADDQLVLAEACVTWAAGHGLETAELRSLVEEARSALGPDGVGEGFYPRIDMLWSRLREQLPRPRTAARAPPPRTAAADEA